MLISHQHYGDDTVRYMFSDIHSKTVQILGFLKEFGTKIIQKLIKSQKWEVETLLDITGFIGVKNCDIQLHPDYPFQRALNS